MREVPAALLQGDGDAVDNEGVVFAIVSDSNSTFVAKLTFAGLPRSLEPEPEVLRLTHIPGRARESR